MSVVKVRLYQLCFHLDLNKRTTIHFATDKLWRFYVKSNNSISTIYRKTFEYNYEYGTGSCKWQENTKATIILLVFCKDLLSGSKYGDIHAVKIILSVTF
jgi:hypothetical protein